MRGEEKEKKREEHEGSVSEDPPLLPQHTHMYLADMQATCNDASLKDIARKLHSLRHY